MGTTRKSQQAAPGSTKEGVEFSVPLFCYRNDISQPKYNRLRAEGRGPKEMRLGLNLIRITLEAEREWQQRMQEEGEVFETQAAERAVKAGAASVRSARHVSKRSRQGRSPP